MQDGDGKSEPEGQGAQPQRKLRLFGREIALPRSRLLRIMIGVSLLIGGVLGFLPVLGFWMIPLGFLVLSFENRHLRRLRRRISILGNKKSKNAS